MEKGPLAFAEGGALQQVVTRSPLEGDGARVRNGKFGGQQASGGRCLD